VDECASPWPMPPQPMRAICTLSLADVFAGGLAAPASKGTPIPAPAAAVVRNSRREVTLYFLSDEEADVVVLAVELAFEVSEEELLPVESFDELADSFLSFLSDLSEEPFEDSLEELELSPSFLPPPLPGLLFPPFA